MGVRSLAVVSVLLGRAASVLHGRAASDATQVLSLTQDFEQLNAHQGDVRALSYVGIGGDIVSGGQDSLVKRWAASDLSPLQPSKLVTYIIYDTAAAPDGSIIATSEGGWNGNAGSDTLRIWSGDLSPWNSTRPAVGYVYSVAVSPVQPSLNKWRVAASGFAGDIAIYSFDVSTSALELEATIATGTKRTFTLAFSPDGELLASGSQKGQVQLWRMSTLELVASLRHSAKFDFSVEFSPDGSRLASGTDKGLLKLWNLATFEEIFSVNVGIGGVYSLSFSASGNEVAVAGNSAIRIFAAANGAILAEELSAHNGRVLDVAFEPQPLAASTRLVSGGRDGAIRLWSLGSGGLP